MEMKFTTGAVLSGGWGRMKSNFLVLLGLCLGYLFISSIFSWISLVTVPMSIGYGVVMLISVIISLVFGLGFQKICLQAVDDHELSFSAFGEMLPKIGIFFCASIIYSLVSILGFALLVVPGIYLTLRLQYYQLFIVEGAGIVESLKKSWDLTEGQFGTLLLLMFAYMGIIIVGILLLFIGVFVSMIWIYVAYTYSYRMLLSLQSVRINKQSENVDEEVYS